MGLDLIVRKGRYLSLSVEGQLLLEHVRRAEAVLLDALEELQTNVLGQLERDEAHHLTIATMGQLDRTHALPAIARLAERAPGVTVSLLSVSPSDALERVAHATLDAFIAYNCPLVPPPLVSTPLDAFAVGAYFAQTHPLFEKKHPPLHEVLAFPFVTPQAPPSSFVPVWPSDVLRKVALRVERAGIALEACLTGRFLCVMSEASAAPFVASGQLRGTLLPFIKPPRISVVTHTARHPSPAGRLLIDELRHAARGRV